MASDDELGGESFEDSSPLTPLAEGMGLRLGVEGGTATRRDGNGMEIEIARDLGEGIERGLVAATAAAGGGGGGGNYLREKFDLPVLDLPCDRARLPVQTYKGERVRVELTPDLVCRIDGVARLEGVTLETFLLAGWKALLHRYTGQEDLMVGTPVCVVRQTVGEREGLRSVKTLPLRTSVSGEISFRELLQRVQERVLGADGELPLEKLAEAMRIESDLSQRPLFQVMFALQNAPGEARAGTMDTEPVDLKLWLEKTGEAIGGHVEFNADLFDDARIERLCGHYKVLLESAAGNCEASVGELGLLTAAEREQLLVTWNATEAPYVRDRCVHELFEEQAGRTPERLAALFEDEALTYRELNGRANAIAGELRALGVGPESRVGICMHRSLGMLAGLLGILKSGAAYVPLDPAYPRERLVLMLEDAQLCALVTEQKLAGGFVGAGTKIVCVEAIPRPQVEENPSSGVAPDNLAYVIYTSGSTGKPKGVMIRHRNVANFFAGMDQVLGTTPGVWLAVTSICFDISVLELLWTVSRGFKVVIQSDQAGLRANSARGAMQEHPAALEGNGIPEQIRRHNVTHFQCTPSLMGMLLQEKGAREAIASVNTVLLGGEALTGSLVDDLQGNRCIINMYGPTETTVWSSSQVIKRGEPITVGRPMVNTRIYILDHFQQPVPIGIGGELHIGGEGVARGYLNRAELTAERFVANPYGTQPGERMYRTGDLARYRADGTIEFLGRLDHQVKLRGFRIELGEIEAALRQLGGVREAVVVVRELKANDKRLAAYIVAETPLEPAELRRGLKDKLPDYMVPSTFTFVPKMPLTPNGKIDRRALPEPHSLREATPTLGRSAKLPGETPKQPMTVDKMRHTPVADMSHFGNGAALIPLTEGQREIWFATQRGDEAACVFNDTFCVELEGKLDCDALGRALQALVNRHEALRISIAPDGQTQTIAVAARVQLERVDLSDIDANAREQRLKELLDAEAGGPFDLANGPLARFHLVNLGDNRHALIITSHQIACDGGSISLMLRDLGQLYTAECRGEKAELVAPYQFSKYARQQSTVDNRDASDAAERYWIEQFAAAPAELELPCDSPRPVIPSFRAGQVRRQLPLGIARELERLGVGQGATLYTTLLSAYYILLHRLTEQEDLVVGVPVSGRGTRLNENMVGQCVNLLPMRLQINRAASVSDHIAAVRQKFVEANDHQSYAFGSLVQQLALPRSANRMPLVSATFNLEECRGGVSFHEVDARMRGNHRLYTNFDLTLDVLERDGELSVDCTYSAELFEEQTISRWLGHFETLLEGMIANPVTAVSQVPLLTKREWKRIAVDWNQTAMEFPRAACIHELFELQAQRTPDAVAATAGRQTITYRELNRRSNQLAHHLKALGVGPNVLVGLCVERSFALLIGAFGILKAGGAYVPLDWTYPPERVRFMIEDTRAPVLVTQANLLQHVPQTSARIVCLDNDWEQIAARETESPAIAGSSVDLAYVMYTSGSTGLAKGVGLEHRSAVSFIHWARGVFSDEELKGVLASTSICFDLSVFELFVPVSWGGTVVLADNAVDLPTPVAGHEITLINTVPSAIKDLLKGGMIPPSVSVVNLAGEKLTTRVVQQLYALGHIKKVYDLYGPSEATTYATWTLRMPDRPPTVGRPLANTQVYILDRHMQPSPVGVPGEIYIGGDCLARGYINRPELTAEKFLPDPFSNGAGGRLYKTGDLGRFLPDGNIDFIGRRDYQIKIRGYRIELGEIEAVLGQHPRVQECVAVVREEAADQKQLAAYVVIGAGINLTATEVRRFLRERLPDYMVPTVFVTLPALPLMPNGKVNRAALPAPSASVTLADDDEPQAITPVQQALIDIWREVIGVDKVGVHDDFFDLGGHSVLVTQITSRVRQVFEVDLSMRHLFGAPTVAALAGVIEQLLEDQLRSLSEEQIHQITAPAKEAS